ncbi:hypothetical protein SAMN06295970_1044 [Noviherbaspirillum suwonense]|uniref:Integrase catalytic domain-containing protein n=1 Tax=Noviherbaspirillum suwonense TaxID=1224511 RepID=A0ABY1PZM1_9BURK|nr:hypothetical protein SAMN06295970_1044 [Noviherbaspirillum suwonense]
MPIERYNRTVRNDLLAHYLFDNLEEVKSRVPTVSLM